MPMVVLGVTIGGTVGWLQNRILFGVIDRARREGKEPVASLRRLFLARYAVDLAVLALFWVLTRDIYGLIAAGLGITVGTSASLFLALRRKGGRIE